MKRRRPSDSTRIAHAGEGGERHHGTVSVPVYHTSTVLFRDLAALQQGDAPGAVVYGRKGTPTTFALQDAIAALEGDGASIVTPSGLSAITTALTALLGNGDHLLMVDSVYGPTRLFCDRVLRRFGVDTTYYAAGEDLRGLLRDTTRAVFLEAPGSLTFEMQDIPGVAAAARARGALTLIDNTWATPLYCKPLSLGVDVSIQSVTKYIGGHSDLMMGAITATGEPFEVIRDTAFRLGLCAGPDDCMLALRGLRTLPVRLRQHGATARVLIDWLRARPEVRRVLYPAQEDDPGHRLWRRDFSGATGLFGVVLEPVATERLAAFVDGLRYFGIGYSWGGFESLVLPSLSPPLRTAAPWNEDGPLLRFHAGLEDPDDLVDDLERGFARLSAGG